VNDVLSLRVRFALGLASRADAADWVTAEVTRRDAIDGALLELSSLAGKTDQDVVDLLTTLAPDEESAARCEIGLLGSLLRTRRRGLAEVVSRLVHLAEALDEEARVWAIGLEDDLCASLRTPEQVRDATLAFCAKQGC